MFGCGDDEPPRDQAVFWMNLSPAQGAMCSSARSFFIPGNDARDIITGGGAGARLVDGEGGGFVSCSVSATGADTYAVGLDFSVGEIGSFSARGSVTNGAGDTPGTGTLDIYFTTTQFDLEQRGCTATVEEAFAGATWISNLSCPGMVDPSSPQISCVGTGGFIAENCSR